MLVTDKLLHLKEEIGKEVTLVAVSKTYPAELIQMAYHAGQRDFGENKVQELSEKAAVLPTDIRWHLIGHLQSNKVKYIASFVYLIHSVDSMKLLQEINKQAVKNNRIIRCLLQIHIAEEESKFGFSYAELNSIIEKKEFNTLTNVSIIGLMGMASNVGDESKIKHEFTGLKTFFDTIKKQFTSDFTILSMGMSGDYRRAISCGSNMVRIGSAIFGARN